MGIVLLLFNWWVQDKNMANPRSKLEWIGRYYMAGIYQDSIDREYPLTRSMRPAKTLRLAQLLTWHSTLVHQVWLWTESFVMSAWGTCVVFLALEPCSGYQKGRTKGRIVMRTGPAEPELAPHQWGEEGGGWTLNSDKEADDNLDMRKLVWRSGAKTRTRCPRFCSETNNMAPTPHGVVHRITSPCARGKAPKWTAKQVRTYNAIWCKCQIPRRCNDGRWLDFAAVPTAEAEIMTPSL